MDLCIQQSIVVLTVYNLVVHSLKFKKIERVTSYKLLGMFIDDDLRWNTHVNVNQIYKKACKRLYSLRLLERADVTTTGILKVYLSVIRPILEYAVPVWQSICETQSEKLDPFKRGR